MEKRKKTQTDKKVAQPSDKLLLLGFLSLILLHILGGFWHSYYSWGFSYWSVFSTNIVDIFGTISIIALLAAYYYRSRIQLDFIDRLQFPNKSKAVTMIYYFVFSLILFCTLYTFRSQAHIYGDGYLILGNVLSLEDVFAESKSFMEFLTIYLYYFTVITAKYLEIFSTANVLGALNAVIGVFGFWAIWSISKLISPIRERRVFLFVTALTSASIILFFGYIENYTWGIVSGLWTLYFSLGYVKRQNGILPLIFFSLISIGFHLITFPFIIVALYAVILRADKINLVVRLRKTAIALFFILSTLIIVFICQTKDLIIFVPLWSILNNPYSLFSFGHINDIFNQLILVAPLSFLLIINFLRQKKNKAESTSNYSKILYMLSVLTLLSSFFIDPQLGAVRDWDLLSLYGIPLTLYVSYSFSELYGEKKFPAWIIVATIIIVFVHIVPNIYEKNHPKLAIEYLDKILWKDPHYQSDYQDAHRGLSWGSILQENVKREDLAVKYYNRLALVNKFDTTPLYNLALVYYEKKQYDSARYYLNKGIKLTPNDPKFYSELSIIEEKKQNYKLAEIYARKSFSLDSTFIPGLTALATLYFNQGKPEKALKYFRKAYNLNPNDYDLIKNLGVFYIKSIEIDSAYFYFNKVLPIAPEFQKVDVLKSLISITIFMAHKTESIEYLNQLKLLAPNLPIIQKFENEINKM